MTIFTQDILVDIFLLNTKSQNDIQTK